MKTRILLSLMLIAALALSGAALADSDYDFDAKVVCVRPEYVTAAIGGTVASVPVLAGQLVSTGDALAELKTTKVYASADGTITGVFCAPGDSVSDVTSRYGALMYIEPDSKYTLTASTDNAYNLSENKYIHVGEAVYLSCSEGTHTGEGFVTAVNGTDFTIEVTTGSFYMGETVSVYRSAARESKTRIGRGDIERIANIAVTGSSGSSGTSNSNGVGGDNASSSSSTASVVALHVSDGDSVKAGDLLLETLSGEYDARYCTGSSLASDLDGILASTPLSVGASISKGDVIATVYPRERLQLEVDVNEADLAALPVGAQVQISFNWNEDSDDANVFIGQVADVLYAAVESAGGMEGEASDTAAYAAYIDFEADENIRLGMTATVRPVSQAAEDADLDEDFEEDFVD